MRWSVVVPFKGAADAKSRLSGSVGDDERAALALAFLVDTVNAVTRVPSVSNVIVVSNQPGLAARLRAGRRLSVDVQTQVIADPAEASTLPSPPVSRMLGRPLPIASRQPSPATSRPCARPTSRRRSRSLRRPPRAHRF